VGLETADRFFSCMDGQMTFVDGGDWFRISIRPGGVG
jgi:hypothetical protein